MTSLTIVAAIAAAGIFYPALWVAVRVVGHAWFSAELAYQLTLVAELEANKGVTRNGKSSQSWGA